MKEIIALKTFTHEGNPDYMPLFKKEKPY